MIKNQVNSIIEIHLVFPNHLLNSYFSSNRGLKPTFSYSTFISILISLNFSILAGFLALLEENEPKLKSFALRKLSAKYDSYVTVLDVFWMEIADKIQTLEMLSEDPDFADRRLAALVASKVHYHLESYDEALSFALGAEELFDVTERSEYVETIIGKY